MAASRYYVIGNSLQVMKTQWFSPFPKDPIEIKDSDIFPLLTPKKNNRPFVVFTDLETAKRCALIKSHNDNMTVSAILSCFRPVIEVTLHNTDAEHLKPTEVKIADGMRGSLQAQGFYITPDNIKDVHSYYYSYGLDNVNQTTKTLDNPVNLHNEHSRFRCSMM
jgi:hypothetical protein